MWTAFINYKIASRSWMRRHDAKKVHLADLTRHIFAYNYTPQLGPGGEHELYFKHPNGTLSFRHASHLDRSLPLQFPATVPVNSADGRQTRLSLSGE